MGHADALRVTADDKPNGERPTVEGMAVAGGPRSIVTTPRALAGLVGGVPHLTEPGRYVYQVGFSFGPPDYTEALLFVWSDQPVLDQGRLFERAEALMVEMFHPSNVGRLRVTAADGDPHGASGPKESS